MIINFDALAMPPIIRVGIEKGLSNNSVRCIYQDRKGFVWFGTYDGLNRYDGSEFKVFRNKLNDSASLPHNYIYSLHEDKFNNLWVATGQGVVLYNNVLSNFLPVYCKRYNSAWPPQKITINVNVINSDENGNVLIGTNGWGLLFKKANEKSACEVLFNVKGELTNGFNVTGIAIANKKIWLFIADVGLCLFNVATQKITAINNDISTANCILPDDNGNIWVGTNNGLHMFSTHTNSYVVSYTEGYQKLNSNIITSLFIDAQKDVWIGTDGGGINILQAKSKTFTYVLPGKGTNTLSSESIYSIIGDNESRIWIGTLKGGCNIIDRSHNSFITVSNNIFNENSLSNNFIYSFYEINNDELLIGTDGGGLCIWNRKTNLFKSYKHKKNEANSLSHNSVASIIQDYKKDIWIATFGGGINKFNKTNGTFEHYNCINDSTKFQNDNVWLLHEDKDKTLWATTFSKGKLYTLNRKKNKFEIFTQQLNNLIAFTEDNSGNIWAGNASQLIKIDKANKKHILYEIGKPVRAIYQDKKSNFWIGSEGGGLILFDPQQGKVIQRFSDADGLCNNAVLNIKEDEDGYLWLSTFNGLSKFNVTKKTFKNFYQSDGLQSNQFSYNAALRLYSGEMVFGGINGFNIFYPNHITAQSYMPAVYITDILINNKPIADLNNYIVSVGNDKQVFELKIPYKEAVLSFRFKALEYSSPEKISYAYYLEGWDKGWNYTGNIRNVNYNNIKEGDFTLHIKSSNSNGEWNKTERILKVTILPPWYRTWWAYLMYVAILGSLFFIFYSYKEQQKKLTDKIKLAQLNAIKEKEINENRQSFFTNITHEFRTPITLIINPIKDILQKKDTNNAAKDELSFVYRNARRLLSLVDQLLLFKKTESDTGILEITEFNFHQLSQEVFLCFVQQAKTRSITYNFECTNTALQILGDKNKLEIVFYNLLSNAFKYTPDSGEISIKITETPNTVEVSVIDNGYGVPSHIGDKLFEKFYRVNEKNMPSKPGFGIGLYLVKQLIDKHKGQINYTNNREKGTTFYFSLYKGSKHFGNIPIQQQENENIILNEMPIINEEANYVQPVITDGLESIVSENPSILITDDNPQMRSYLIQVFQAAFIVHEAASAEEGLKKAKEFQPDVIISDVIMEKMSGIDFCKAVKDSATLSHIPFILITGSFSPESKLKGIENGADDYITKPFEKNMLVARVKGLIRNHQNLQKYFYNEITHQKNTLNISEEYKEFLNLCIAIVEKNIDNDQFNINMLATEIGMSHSKLYKKIKAISGQSANAFIRFIRLRKAAEMFINTSYNVNETAFYVGIKDSKYFREHFSKTFGLKPSQYIEKYRKTFGKNYKLNEKVTKDNNE